jgi:hypothetical protein
MRPRHGRCTCTCTSLLCDLLFDVVFLTIGLRNFFRRILS